MNEFQEVVLPLDDKKMSAVIYGWENDALIVIDKDTGIEHHFVKI